jgi:fido (protein-threonine AMPylation protein)
MEFKIDAAEREATEDLIRDFGIRKDLTVEEVYKTSWHRFNIIEGSQHKVRLLHQLVQDDEYKYNYENLPLALHYYMYENLYTFAGEVRKYNDPYGGKIYFGRQHAHRRKPEFEGSPPVEIENEMRIAVKYLHDHLTKFPLEAAIRFYQKFVFTHPFYDGNGRIARLMANTYLAGFDLTISWSEFDNKNKFIRKLNWCHKNQSNESYNSLINYIHNYTIPFKDLET